MQLTSWTHAIVCGRGSIELRESFDKRVQSQKTTHDTLVITEEKEIETGNDTDCDVQFRSTKPEVASTHDCGGGDRSSFFFLCVSMYFLVKSIDSRGEE